MFIVEPFLHVNLTNILRCEFNVNFPVSTSMSEGHYFKICF